MSTCLAPACPSPRLDLGTFAFLCLEHALSMHSGTSTAAAPMSYSASAPQRPDLRGRCWGDGLTCPRPTTARTAHGGYCGEHLPAQPRPIEAEPGVEDERATQVAVLAVMAAFAGAKVESTRANLWASRAYGDSEGVQITPSRHYARTSSRAVAVELDDDRVPRNARAMARTRGWSVSLRYACAQGEAPESLALKAWRGPYLIVATWHGGKFATAWLQHSRGMPVSLGARQAGAFLKVAP